MGSAVSIRVPSHSAVTCETKIAAEEFFAPVGSAGMCAVHLDNLWTIPGERVATGVATVRGVEMEVHVTTSGIEFKGRDKHFDASEIVDLHWLATRAMYRQLAKNHAEFREHMQKGLPAQRKAERETADRQMMIFA